MMLRDATREAERPADTDGRAEEDRPGLGCGPEGCDRQAETGAQEAEALLAERLARDLFIGLERSDPSPGVSLDADGEADWDALDQVEKTVYLSGASAVLSSFERLLQATYDDLVYRRVDVAKHLNQRAQ